MCVRTDHTISCSIWISKCISKGDHRISLCHYIWISENRCFYLIPRAFRNQISSDTKHRQMTVFILLFQRCFTGAAIWKLHIPDSGFPADRIVAEDQKLLSIVCCDQPCTSHIFIIYILCKIRRILLTPDRDHTFCGLCCNLVNTLHHGFIIFCSQIFLLRILLLRLVFFRMRLFTVFRNGHSFRRSRK